MTQQELDELLELIDEADAEARTDWEIEFVGDMREKALEWGRNTFISDQQRAKLEQIAEGRS